MIGVALDDVWPHLDLKTLFRLHWGGKGLKDEAWTAIERDEFLPRLARMQRDAIAVGWLQPRVRYERSEWRKARCIVRPASRWAMAWRLS